MNGERVEKAAALAVDHVAGRCCCYPGEAVTLHTRLRFDRPLPGYRLSVSLPFGLALEDHAAPEGQAGDPARVLTLDDGEQRVIWQVERPVAAGTCCEYRVQARVEAALEDAFLPSRAAASVEGETGWTPVAEETACITVSIRGSYLHHLPGVYQDDELMGRFLMLFESFWKPIVQIIDQVPYYFDPGLTPTSLLPWLATWFDLVLDERWPEERRRRLLQSAVRLYRKRGTRQGLGEYLETFTGERVQVTEHRAQNFRLGPAAYLGTGSALGTRNVPHTFTVTLHLPPVEAADPEEAQRLAAERRHIAERIIEAEKPAHAAYTLVAGD